MDAWKLGLIATTLLVAAAGPGLADQVGKIQPGDRLDGVCTLNFVFEDGQDKFLGTAAHCTSEGDDASTRGFGVFGTTVYVSNALDFALIEVAEAHEDDVVPDVAGHPGEPAGVATPDETAAGDPLVVSGWGMAVSYTATTGENRPAVLVSHTSTQYEASGVVVNGDSGGPILHEATGEALGIVSRYNLLGVPPTTDVGPTVEGILADLHANGYGDLQLATAS